MKRTASLILALILVLAIPCGVLAQKGGKSAEVKAQADAVELELRVERFNRQVKQLQENFAREISERDRLMLQKRFVAGKEFYFMLDDYRNAAEIFWGIVLHPEAQNFPKFHDALYFLAESLFQCGYYYDSQQQFERLVAMGSSGPYFSLSLMRQIEISIAQKNYGAAEKYFAKLIAESPEGTDSSLGLYLVGKSHYIQGNATKAFQVFESIPETANYYPIAQYYMAALQVKQGSYDEALTRLRKLKSVFKLDEEIAHREEVVALTHLSMGRLFYETDDFPQAITQYMSVPPESKYFPEALYESMWVLTTRNDFLLKAISEEDSNYTSLVNDYSFFSQGLDLEQDKERANPFVSEGDSLEPPLSEMNVLFAKIDKSLARLQEEASKSYENLITAAPGSPYLPEAEMLMAGIYSQVSNYDQAEQWYKRAQNKYSDFAIKVRNARTRFRDDQTAVQAVQAGSKANTQYLPDTSRTGVPPQVAYWIAAEPEVKNMFALFEQVQLERQNLRLMRDISVKIEQEIRNLESGAGFPVMRQSRRRADDLRTEADSIASFINVVASEIPMMKHEDEQQVWNGKLTQFRKHVEDGRVSLKQLERSIQKKKQERIASYRQDYRTYTEPIANYATRIEQYYADISDRTATAARQALSNVDKRLHDYILQAKMGVVDTSWKSTERSSDEIKDMQRQMEEEIRQFRRQIRGESGSQTESGE